LEEDIFANILAINHFLFMVFSHFSITMSLGCFICHMFWDPCILQLFNVGNLFRIWIVVVKSLSLSILEKVACGMEPTSQLEMPIISINQTFVNFTNINPKLLGSWFDNNKTFVWNFFLIGSYYLNTNVMFLKHMWNMC
jgi:hypothetical protein